MHERVSFVQPHVSRNGEQVLKPNDRVERVAHSRRRHRGKAGRPDVQQMLVFGLNEADVHDAQLIEQVIDDAVRLLAAERRVRLQKTVARHADVDPQW